MSCPAALCIQWTHKTGLILEGGGGVGREGEVERGGRSRERGGRERGEGCFYGIQTTRR